MVGREPVEAVVGLGLDRAVDVQERDVGRGAGQAEATADAFVACDEARFDESREKPADHDRIGVHTRRDLGGRDLRTDLVGEVGEDVNADGEA